jgi:GAF domain-containing protein
MIFARIKQLFIAPVFADEEKTRLAALLNTLVLGVLGLSILSTGYYILSGNPEASLVFYSVIGLMAALVIVFVLLRLGYVTPAGWLFILAFSAIDIYWAVYAGGVRDSEYAMLLVLTTMAGLLLGGISAVVLAGLFIFVGLGLVWAEQYGLLPPYTSDIMSIWVDQTINFIGLAIILFLSSRNIQSTLRRVHSREQELATRNLELQATQVSLENRNRGLELVAAMSERLGIILDVGVLLSEIVKQIRASFGYRHIYIYLFNQKQSELTLTASTDPAGAEMRDRKISLRDQTHPVTRAVYMGEVIKIYPPKTDTGSLEPLCIEIAVPIMVGGEKHAVGVLYVQNPGLGLDEGDTALLRSLASQAAVAIRNARLFAEVETALTEARAAQEHYAERAWQQVKSAPEQGQSLYIAPAAAPVDESQKQQMVAQARAQAWRQSRPVLTTEAGGGQSLIAPIALRGKTIGALQLRSTGAQKWDEDDRSLLETVLDQLAQTAETLRLFDETRERAGREQTIRRITDKLRAAPSLDVLLETAARELGQRLGVRHTVLELGIEPEANGPGRPGQQE